MVLDPKTNREAPVSLLVFFAMISAVPLALSRATNVVALVTGALTLAVMNAPMALTGDHFKAFTAINCGQRKLQTAKQRSKDYCSVPIQGTRWRRSNSQIR